MIGEDFISHILSALIVFILGVLLKQNIKLSSMIEGLRKDFDMYRVHMEHRVTRLEAKVLNNITVARKD